MADHQAYNGLKTVLTASVDDAEARVRAALGTEGFGVLTYVDVAATFKEKLDVAFRGYRILGACNPPLAHQALTTEVDIGLLLPCNVVVYEGDEPGTAVVAVLDPVRQLEVAGRDDLSEVALDVRRRMERVVAAL